MNNLTDINKNSDFSAEDVNLALDINPEMLNRQEEEIPLKDNQFIVAGSEGAMSGAFDWIRCILFAVAIVVFVLTFVFRLVEVEGSSMDNTLTTGDKVVVTDLFYTPSNGDIVVISHGALYDRPIIKRVIATSGQTVKLDYENERIIVDGIEISEPYIKESAFCEQYGDNEIPEVIPEGKVFVMGDNRRVSLDSRNTQVGLIDIENIIGKAQFVAFPFDDFGYLYD